MINSPASSGAKRTIQRREINPATPLPESRIYIHDSACRINYLLSL
jgi:hypothetical protein